MMTFRHRHIVDADPPGRRMLARVSSLSSLEPQFNGWSRFNLSSKARVFFGIISVFAGTYAYSSSAMAEVEEDTSQEINKPGYSTPTLSNDITANLLIDNYTNEDMVRYLSTLDSFHNEADLVNRDAETYTGSHPAFSSSTNPHGIDDALIPETVWSLDASSGTHLDHIPGGPGSDIYAVFGGRPEINNFWIGASFGWWANKNTDGASGLLVAPPKFQVASCGGSSAEHSDLDYCDSAKLAADQPSDAPHNPEQSNNNTSNN